MKIRYSLEDGRLGKAYPEDMVVPEPFIILTKDDYDAIVRRTDLVPFVVDGQITFKTIEEVEAEEKLKQFHKDFFNTSLGYVRRKVTMKDGAVKDFLADILPILQVGIPILTYTIDGKQNKVVVTEQFINECKQQVITDFYGV